MADNDTEVRFGADITSLSSGISKASAVVKDGFANIKEEISSVNESFASLATGFGAMLAIVAGGELGAKLKETVMSAAEFGDQLVKTSQKTGMSVEELGKLKYAGDMADVSFTSMQMGIRRLSMSMQQAAQGSRIAVDAFQRVGISASQLKTMSPMEVLSKMADAFSKTADNADKTALAQQLFGRAGAGLIPLLNQGSEGFKKYGDEAQRLGLVLDTSTAEAGERTVDAFKRIHASTEGIMLQFGVQMLPLVQQLAEGFSESASTGGTLSMVMTGLGNAMKGVYIVIQAFGIAVAEVAMVAVGAFNTIFDSAMAVGKVLDDIFHLRFEKARQDWKKGWSDATGDVKDALKSIEEAEAGFQEKMDATINGSTEKKPGAEAGGEKPGIGGATNLQSKMKDYENELEKQKMLYMQKNNLREMDKAEETQYWVSIANDASTSADDRASINKKIMSDDISMYQQMKKQQDEMAKESIASDLAVGKSRIAQAEEDANLLVKSGQMTETQLLSNKRAYLDADYGLERDAQSKLVALAEQNPDNPAAVQKEKDKLLLIDEKYNQDVTKNAAETAAAQQASFNKMFDSLKNDFTPMTSAWDSAMNQMIGGTMSLSQVLNRTWLGLEMSFVKMGMGMVEDWISAEAKKVLVAEFSQQEITAATIAGGAERAAIAGAQAVEQMMLDAWTAMAGVYASVSSIPVIGWILAPALAVGAFAAVAGMAAHAEGGYDIPAGVNPLTQLHQREMVLPAHLADPLRGALAGGGLGGAGNGMQVHIHATDAESVTRLFTQNGSAIMNAIKKQLRGGAR